MTVPFTYQRTERGAVVSTFLHGEIHVADDSHPNWVRILREFRQDNPDEATLVELFTDAAKTIREDLSNYTDRVTIVDGRVLVDGDAVSGHLPDKIVKVYNKGQSPRALVLFLENLSDNPSHRSREQLFAYLDKHDFQITEDGCFVAYKGLSADGRSVRSGVANVDGVEVNGRIPNDLGAVVTMPRSKISDDPNVACHAGLHAGTWAYASGFGHKGCTAKVKVNPKHVVSVPADANQQKIRTERYEVLEVNLTQPNDHDDVYDSYNEWDLDESYNEGWNEGWDEGYAQGQADAGTGAYV